MRKRFFANGEPTAGTVLHAPYLRIAQGLLDAVKMQMQASGLQQLGQQYTTETGVTIRATSRFGQDEIWIDVPVQPSPPQELPKPEFMDGYYVWAAIVNQSSNATFARQYSANGVATGREIQALSNASFDTMIVAHGALWGVGGRGATDPDFRSRLVRYNLGSGEGVEVFEPSNSSAHTASIVMTPSGVVYATVHDIVAVNADGSIRAHLALNQAEWNGTDVYLATDGTVLVWVLASVSAGNTVGEGSEEGMLCLSVADLSVLFSTHSGAAQIDWWQDYDEADLVYHKADGLFHAIASPIIAVSESEERYDTYRYTAPPAQDLSAAEYLGVWEFNSGLDIPGVNRTSLISAGDTLVKMTYHGRLSTGGAFDFVGPRGKYARYCAWDGTEFLWGNFDEGLQKVSLRNGAHANYGKIQDDPIASGAIAIQFWSTDPLNTSLRGKELASVRATQHRG